MAPRNGELLLEDLIPDWVFEEDRDRDHGLAADEKTLAESREPKSRYVSVWDRRHMKLTGDRPGLDEVKITKRMLRKKPGLAVSPAS